MDRFEALRKAQEGTLERTPFTPEEQLEHVSKREEEDLSMSVEEKRAKILNMILLVMVFVLIGLFLYLFFTDRLLIGIENPLSKKEEVVAVEEKKEVLAEEESLKLYKNTREVFDSNGNVVGTKELSLRIFPDSLRFEMEILDSKGSVVVVNGLYIEEGSKILLPMDEGVLNMQGSLEFLVSSEDGTVLEYTGSDFGDTLPKAGDRYLLY